MLPLAKAPLVCGVLWTVKAARVAAYCSVYPCPQCHCYSWNLSLVLFTLPLFNFFFLFWLIIHLHFSWRCVEETKGD